jgi:hypothetical protein
VDDERRDDDAYVVILLFACVCTRASGPRARRVDLPVAHDDGRQRLVAAVETKLVSLDGLSPVLVESLVLMAGLSAQPADIGDAGRAVRDLLGRMASNRVRRLGAAGLRPLDRAAALRTPDAQPHVSVSEHANL